MLNVTTRAAEQLKKLIEKEESNNTMVRVFVNGYG